MELSTMNLMTWSLYIFTSKCFEPGSETQSLMITVEECFNRLATILSVANNFETQF